MGGLFTQVFRTNIKRGTSPSKKTGGEKHEKRDRKFKRNG